MVLNQLKMIHSYKKKYRKAEYIQRRVCFVNVQVYCPYSNI